MHSIFIFSGKSAYEMYKLDVDWSPSLHLGHDKLKSGSAKLAEAQQRANRAAVRAERREEILGRPGDILPNEICGAENENSEDLKTHDQQTETEHTGDLPVDFFGEEHLTIKCCITQDCQMQNCCQVYLS